MVSFLFDFYTERLILTVNLSFFWFFHCYRFTNASFSLSFFLYSHRFFLGKLHKREL